MGKIGQREPLQEGSGNTGQIGMQQKRKISNPTFVEVICPCCRHRFADRNVKKAMYVFEDKDPKQPPWEPDFAVKCKICKNTLRLFSK